MKLRQGEKIRRLVLILGFIFKMCLRLKLVSFFLRGKFYFQPGRSPLSSVSQHFTKHAEVSILRLGLRLSPLILIVTFEILFDSLNLIHFFALEILISRVF